MHQQLKTSCTALFVGQMLVLAALITCINMHGGNSASALSSLVVQCSFACVVTHSNALLPAQHLSPFPSHALLNSQALLLSNLSIVGCCFVIRVGSAPRLMCWCRLR